MARFISRGYGPPDDPELRDAKEIEDELFRQYFPLIRSSSETILETPRYFFCQLKSAWFSSLWIYGGGPIPLGVLVFLWDQCKMVYDCLSCDGSIYAVGIRGSILSGSGYVWGLCERCGWCQRDRQEGDGTNMTAVGELLRVYRNEPIIEKGTQPIFDWKDGLKGEYTPDRVIVPAVEPVDLWTLIRELTGIADPGVAGDSDYAPKPAPERVRPRGMTFPILLEKKRKK